MTEQSPAEAIFFSALEKKSPEERTAYLDTACEGEPELRRRVERMIEVHSRARDFLESPATSGEAATANYAAGREQVGEVIAGRYKLLEQIGEGGMGTVWMAQQTEPVKRLVAVKLIKPGMDSKEVLARFEAERQALALMDHPHIAKVFDAGATSAGRPFFAMELVKGVPITKYCDELHLPVRERLALFIPVCQAVQHAHQKGIIHRDLKPSNVLIARYDGRPVPKVIDFGVAKAAGQALTERTLVTGFGTVVGTAEYMSPEQAEFNQLDIDTRSDVYALGILLYELMTGSTPFNRKELEKVGLLEVLRVIREQEPPRPSTKVSAANALPTVAANRGTEPKALAQLLRNELDWIVMKALEKDRNRRYESANGFAADVQNYLSGEPVSAVPPSASYRLRKYLRKHRGPVAAVMIVFLALVVGVIGTTFGLVEAWKQGNAARRAEAIADQRRREVERTAASLQIDLNLAEIRDEWDDSEFGLLRLAGTVKDLPADYQSLREFATVAVLAIGQSYAPLVPPIRHDEHDILYHQLSADGRIVLTLATDRTARIWDTRTSRPVALLRRGNEQVLACALSPDGKTAITDSEDGVLRFWDIPAGTFRAETASRPDRYGEGWLSGTHHRTNWLSSNWIDNWRELVTENEVNPPGDRVTADRVLTMRFVGEDERSLSRHGPVELWDTTTGQRVARLDQPGMSVPHFQFVAQGRWVTTIEKPSTVVVFSSTDGEVLARLTHADLDPSDSVVAVFGPTGRRIVTVVGPGVGEFSEPHQPRHRLYAWEGETWRPLPGPMSRRVFMPQQVRDLGDDLFAIWQWEPWLIWRYGEAEPIAEILSYGNELEVKDNQFLDGEGNLFDLHSGRRLFPPKSKRYHLDLARFARDGRFLGNIAIVIDTLTDKGLATHWVPNDDEVRTPLSRLPGVGHCGVLKVGTEIQTYLIPTPVPDIPPDFLELWAQVAVRGEIGPAGNFNKWDEKTWELKRKELATRSAPSGNFPFPGHVATDLLHWRRSN